MTLHKKLRRLLALALLLVVLFPLATLGESVIVNITHDANNLDEYDGTVTDGGDLSTNTPGLVGTAAKMTLFIDDANAMQATKNIAGTTRARFRFHFDLTDLTMGAAEAFQLLTTYDGPARTVSLYLQYDGTYFEAWHGCGNDGGGTDWGGTFDIGTTGQHYIEADWKASTGPGDNNGYLSLWIDGVFQETIAGVDNDTRASDEIRFDFIGIDFPGTSGTLYIDEFRANDDGSEIGPAYGIPGGMMRLGVGR